MAFPPSPWRPCQSVELRPDVPVPSQAGSILREGWPAHGQHPQERHEPHNLHTVGTIRPT